MGYLSLQKKITKNLFLGNKNFNNLPSVFSSQGGDSIGNGFPKYSIFSQSIVLPASLAAFINKFLITDLL